jgi:hypothetical protein
MRRKKLRLSQIIGVVSGTAADSAASRGTLAIHSLLYISQACFCCMYIVYEVLGSEEVYTVPLTRAAHLLHEP